MTTDPGSQRTRRLAAVWFADIQGYTELYSRNEDAALSVVDDFQRLAHQHVSAHGGRVVKFIGDAVLTVFDSTDAALRAALAFRAAFGESGPVKEHRLALRVGVHLGEVVEAEDGDVYGDGVNTASRVEAAAEPNQVAVTETVFQQIKNRPAFHTWELGERDLKGIPEPVLLYEVSLEPPTATKRRSGKKRRDPKQSRLYRRATALGIMASLVGFATLMATIASRGEPAGAEAGAEAMQGESTDLQGPTPASGTAAPRDSVPANEESPDSETGPATVVAVADTTAAEAPATSSATSPTRPPPPAWSFAERRDPIDGSNTASLSVVGPNGVEVTLHCIGRSTQVSARWPAPLLSGDVTMRVDAGRASEDRWQLSADSSATTYRGDARRILRLWAAAQSIAIRATGRGGDITDVLPITGLEPGLDRLEFACR